MNKGDTYMQDADSDQVLASVSSFFPPNQGDPELTVFSSFQSSPSNSHAKPIKPYEGPSFGDHQNHYANTTPQWVYGNATYNNKQSGLNSLNTGYQVPAFNSNYSSAPYSGDVDSLSSTPPGLIVSGLRSKIRQTPTGHERKRSSGCESSDSFSANSVDFDAEESQGLGSRAYQTSLQELSPLSKGAKHQQKQFTKNASA